MGFRLRVATAADVPAIKALISDSVRGLQAQDYTAQEIEWALTTVFTVDSQLIADGTYFVAVCDDETLAGCGGWSFRKTLYGGDAQLEDAQPERLDPTVDAAARELIHGQSNLVVLPAQGGEIETVVNEHGPSLPYDWSPDGRRIAFAGLRNGIWNIYWVDRFTHEVRQITRFATPSASVGYPAWSPKGDQIVFERYDQLANIYVAAFR